MGIDNRRGWNMESKVRLPRSQVNRTNSLQEPLAKGMARWGPLLVESFPYCPSSTWPIIFPFYPALTSEIDPPPQRF